MYVPSILYKCYIYCYIYNNSCTEFAVTRDVFAKITKGHIGKIKDIYGAQCPSIYNQQMKTDNTILQIIAVGKELGIDYLQHVVDLYDRARVQKLKDNQKQNLKYDNILRVLQSVDLPIIL